VRDYIHVVDLAKAHAAAISYAEAHKGCEAINVGTGQGASVLDVVKAFEAGSGQSVPYEVVARRAGDIAACYADASKAQSLLGWQATRDLDNICETAWKWQSQNPNGYTAD
jgi:UDP-glucose 4-epimerase